MPGLRIGFIGAGSMVGAIVRGAAAAGRETSGFLLTSAGGASARALAQEVGAASCQSNDELVANADMVVLGVKPYTLPGLLDELAVPLAEHSPLVVSLAAGLSLARLEGLAPSGTRIVRAMPNIAAGVGQSMTALAAGAPVSPEDLAAVEDLMGAVGRTVVLADKDFPAFVGLAGSSPAFVLTFIDALARAGVLGGIPRAQAVEIVTQAVLGTARLLQAEADSNAAQGRPRTPADLIDAVCSPGGTTVAGVVALQRAGFSDAVVRAFEATVARDRELGS
ncbi:pyrroline-5-carboxylate reductase [Actinomyces capricornis]|uniref:Pyrroline-5-carboxylate reductase n=1 Tax=Actinomyces capricornis TaxID=2755559 RepID=A0ABN6K4V8_9ACTO|nr:pyrroline-5-carboxylate reductase [Actinomyces capricornis]